MFSVAIAIVGALDVVIAQDVYRPAGCAVNRRNPDYELVPFARLFDDNPYELLAPPGELADQSTEKEPRP